MKFYIPIVTIFLINSVASEVCYAGGMKNHPISANTVQPPCWYKSHDGTYSCYNYIFGGLCPFAKAIKPFDTALNLAAKKPEAVSSEAKKPETVNLDAEKPESVKLTAAKANGRFPMLCFRGNMRNHPVPAIASPPCWYKEKDGFFSCYEFDPETKKCPTFPNRVKRPY